MINAHVKCVNCGKAFRRHGVSGRCDWLFPFPRFSECPDTFSVSVKMRPAPRTGW